MDSGYWISEEALFAYLNYLSRFGYTLKSEMADSFEMFVAALEIYGII